MDTTRLHSDLAQREPLWPRSGVASQRVLLLLPALRRQRGRVYARFAAAYRRLLFLPARVRRRWLRRLGLSLAGAALLLALHGGAAASAPANTIVVDGVNCNLVDAIIAANTDTATGGCPAGSGADVIDLQAPVILFAPYTGAEAAAANSFGATGLPVITSAITIQGNGNSIMRSSAADFRIFTVGGDGDLMLDSVTVSNGRTQSDGESINRLGGGLHAREGSTVQIANSTFNGNSAYLGGGIGAANHTTVIVTNSTISNNSANFGGGIQVVYSSLTVANSTLTSNSTTNSGGGIGSFGSTVNVADSNLSANTAPAGGGLFGNRSTITVANSTISGNTATSGGGAIDTRIGTMILANSTLSGNSAAIRGGGIYTAGSASFSNTLTIANSTLSGNTAGWGGGLNASSSSVTVTHSTLSANSATSSGGGVYSRSTGDLPSTLTIANSMLSGNSAGWGGGLNLNSGTATVMNSTLLANTAATSGGGVYSRSTGELRSALTIANSTLSGNTAGWGGALNANASDVTLANSTLAANAATNVARGISFFSGATANIANSILTGQVTAATLNQADNDCAIGEGSVLESGGYNIESGVTCGFTSAGDQQNVDAGALKLQPAGENGGPASGAGGDPMRTHALDASSVAIDHIPPGVNGCQAGVSRDQRGFVRAGGPGAGGEACDVGAYESNSALPTPAPTETPTPTPTPTPTLTPTPTSTPPKLWMPQLWRGM